MNDEETVALIAGGHTFGKTHGAADPDEYVGRGARGRADRAAWASAGSSYGSGKAEDTITSGLEVTWTATPTQWGNGFFDNLFGYEWELTKSPAGAHQWKPKDGARRRAGPGAHDGGEKRPPTMLTTDLALRMDPAYEKISRRFHENPEAVRRRVRPRLVQAHPPRHGADPALPRPGGAVGDADLAGPGPAGPSIDATDVAALKAADPRVRPVACRELVSAAWASASTFRGSDKRGGANGARIRLEPQKLLGGQQPRAAGEGASKLEEIQARLRQARLARRPDRPRRHRGGREGRRRRRRHGRPCRSPPAAATRPRSRPTRTPSPRSSRPPTASATTCAPTRTASPAEHLLVDRANLLTLSAPELTVLVGGLRVLGANGTAPRWACSPTSRAC